MKLLIKKDATDVTLYVLILDSSSTTGAGKTGLAFNTASLTCYYVRPGGNSAQLTLATQTVTGAHADGGFVEVDPTNLPGVYRLDLSDAIVATGVNSVVVQLKGAAGMAPVTLELELVAFDPQDATRLGLTALPAAAAEAAGGLATLSAAQASDGTIPANVHRWLTGTPNPLQSGRVDSYLGAVAAGVIAAGSFAANALDAVWSTATRLLTAGTNVVDTLEARLTSARAGYLDNLNVGGLVASSAEVTAIQNNTRAVIIVPEVIERPDTGTATYRVELFLYDTAGNMEAPDSAPTIALVNQAGADRSSRLDSTTMALVSTGRYRAIYTADAADALEQLVWAFSIVEGGATRLVGRQSLIVDTTAVDFTSADRTKLDAIHGKLPSKNFLTGTQNSDGDAQLDEMTGGLNVAAKADVNAEADTALADVGVTSTVTGRIDVAVSSRLATSGYTAPLDAAGTRAAIGLAAANLDTQLAVIAAFIDTEVAAIKTNTDLLAAAQVEPSAVPAANASPLAKLAWLFTLARNKVTQTATTQTLYADDGTTPIATAAVSDDGSTFERAEFV